MALEENSTKAQGSSFTLDELIGAYYDIQPDVSNTEHLVCFGTSGHRGSSFDATFNEAHILAITQAVCDYRSDNGIRGPLFIGKDTHGLSDPALQTALCVLAANEVRTFLQADDLPTPTPVISHAILCHNRENDAKADGIIITPSHNPPEDGGFKYSEYHGGPASAEVTDWISKRANEYLSTSNKNIRRVPVASPSQHTCLTEYDFIRPYVEDLKNILNMDAIAASGLKIAADPLGGSALPLWEPIAERYKLNLTVVNPELDPLFRFMPPDHDGRIRMDCSSPYAMANLIALGKDYDLAFGNDPDADRHGIVTPLGLMNPNHYLCAAIWYLLQNRDQWSSSSKIGKTTVTTSLMDHICDSCGKTVYETPVGFKWFVDGLFDGSLLFGGEESAGASFLRFNGQPWTTDKDGIILNLLAAELTAVLGKNPAELYTELTQSFFAPCYQRIDVPSTAEEKAAFKQLSPASITQSELAGAPIMKVLTHAPGNDASIGGLKVETRQGWFAARPSGTENIYKIYAESFVSQEHLQLLQQEARAMLAKLFAKTL